MIFGHMRKIPAGAKRRGPRLQARSALVLPPVLVERIATFAL